MASLLTGTTIGGNLALHAGNYTNYVDAKQFANFVGTAAGGAWYTIAVNPGDRASALFMINDFSSGCHQSVHFIASHFFSNGDRITVLHNDYYSTSPFRYIRIKKGGTYDGAMLQVYLDNNSDAPEVIITQNEQSSGWIVKNWIADGTNPGNLSNYAAVVTVAVTVDLDVGAPGNLISSGAIAAPIFYDSDDASYSLDLANTGTSLKVAGNIGVGTTVPGWKLDVNGNARIGANTSQKTFAALSVSSGQNSAILYRDIDIIGSWTGGEGHAITASYGSASGNIVGQEVFQYDSPGSRIRWGKLYHSGDSSTFTMDLISESTTSAYLTVAGSVRSPIFYDSNNTAYYLDPASTSILNRINLNTAATAYIQWRSAGQGTIAGGYPFYNNVSYGSINIEVSDNDYGGLVIDNEGVTVYGAADNGQLFRTIDEDVYQTNGNVIASATTFWINQGQDGGGVIRGTFTSTGDFRAPVFYDSGDTNYYLDPGNTGISLLVAGKVGIGTTTTTYALDVRGDVRIGNGSSTEQDIRFFSLNGDWQVGTNNGGNGTNNNQFYIYDSAYRLTVQNGTGNVGIGAASPDTNLQVVGHVHVGNQTTFENSGGWNKTIYLDGTVHARLRILGSAYASGKNSATETNIWVDNSQSPYSGLSTNAGSFQISAGYTTMLNSARSPIFYDSDDTTYYVNPNSASNLYNLTIGNWTTNQSYPGILILGNIGYNYNFLNGTWTSSITAGIVANCSDEWEFVIHDSGTSVESAFIYQNSTGIILMGRDIGWGTTPIRAASDFRAPIFYDSDDTNYYLNPAGTSSLNLINHYGANAYGGDSASVYSSYNTAASNALQFRVLHSGSNVKIFNNRGAIFLNDNGNNVGVGTTNPTSSLHVKGAVSAPSDSGIFEIGDAARRGLSFGYDDSTNQGWVYCRDVGVSSRVLNLNVGSLYVLGGSYAYSPYSLRAPVFYDYNNTAYYCDPASTSVLNVISLQGAITHPGGVYLQTTTTGLAYTNHFQIREASGGNGSTNEIYAPALGFHWAGTVASNILLESTGRIAIRNNPATGYENLASSTCYAYNFYDLDNTNYYLDPANTGTSLKVAGSVGIATTAPISSGKLSVYAGGAAGVGWGTGLNIGDATNYTAFIQDGGVSRWRNYGTGGYDWWGSAGNQRMSLTDAGVLTGNVDIRSPIFYDSNDTGYYVDPASTSVVYLTKTTYNTASSLANGTFNVAKTILGGLHFNNGNGISGAGKEAAITFQGGAADEAQAGIYVHNNNSEGTHMAFATTDSYTTGPQIGLRIMNSGYSYFPRSYVEAANSFRAPIFYDSNDTNYYVDPASTSSLNVINHYGINFYGSDSGVVYSSYNTSASNALQFRISHSLGNVKIFNNRGAIYINDNGNNVGIGTTAAATSLQIGGPSPTAATSGIQFGDDTGARIYRSASGVVSFSSNINTGAYISAGSYVYAATYLQTGNHNIYPGTLSNSLLLNVGNSANNAWVNGITIAAGGIVTIYGDIRSPIFYDSANTAYYTDPASTSVLNTLNSSTLNGSVIGVNNTTNTNGYGISLYNGAVAGEPTYGLMFQGTATFGTHGSVTGDWATYFTMNNDNTRGWIFRKVGQANVASISGGGTLTVTSDIRSPVFYDSSDIAYYLDPANSTTSAILNGKVGIGTTAPSVSYKLDVNGGIHYTSSTASSDIRFKKNITIIDNALGKLDAIRGVRYEWNEFINSKRDGYKLNEPTLGVIAQEVETVFPELVTTWDLSEDCHDAKGVNYEKFVPVLIQAVKELKAKNESLEARILILEEKFK